MLKIKDSTASQEQEQEQDKSMHAILDYQITHMNGVDKIWIGSDRITDRIADRITDRTTDRITEIKEKKSKRMKLFMR